MGCQRPPSKTPVKDPSQRPLSKTPGKDPRQRPKSKTSVKDPVQKCQWLLSYNTAFQKFWLHSFNVTPILEDKLTRSTDKFWQKQDWVGKQISALDEVCGTRVTRAWSMPRKTTENKMTPGWDTWRKKYPPFINNSDKLFCVARVVNKTSGSSDISSK